MDSLYTMKMERSYRKVLFLWRSRWKSGKKFDETQSNTYQGQSLPAKKNSGRQSLFVTIRDEEIIVLGGLQEVQVDSTESKYNLLSDFTLFWREVFSDLKRLRYTPTELLIFSQTPLL